MKSIILLTAMLASLSWNVAYSAVTVNAKTDERIELLSIVFRLAGNDEYNMNQFKGYVDDINQWFGPYKNHPVVAMAKRLRMTRGVSYDAVMSMAVHISQPPELQPLVPLTSGVPDHRWGKLWTQGSLSRWHGGFVCYHGNLADRPGRKSEL